MTILAKFRAAAVAGAAILACAASTFDANAQTRTFNCGTGRAITLTVTGPNSISAGLIEGGTKQLQKNPQNPLQFLDGEYSVTITPDQTGIEVAIPDFGSVTCIFQQAATPGQPGLGNTDPCGPGYQQAPGTRRCEPRPGNVAQAAPRPQRRSPQKRADDPCPAGFIQAPETDRCDPAPGAPAPRQAAPGAGKLPMGGRSLGGIMRAGPSQSLRRVKEKPQVA